LVKNESVGFATRTEMVKANKSKTPKPQNPKTPRLLFGCN